MYKSFLSGCLSILINICLSAQPTPIGIWKTVDDNTGEARSHLEIYEQQGKLHGKLVKLLTADPDTVCDQCTGEKKDQPLMNMVILWDLKPHKDYWSYGRILDPENGKTYKCSVWLDGQDKLKVRGYIGVSALGRTQEWDRVK